MKQILSLLIAALSLITFSNHANAQKDTSAGAAYKTWDDLLAKTKKDKKTDATTETRLKAISEQWSAAIEKSIATKTTKEPWKDWKPKGKPNHGDIDLLPLMEEIPNPVYTLPIAAQMDIDAKFDPYITKIESKQKQL